MGGVVARDEGWAEHGRAPYRREAVVHELFDAQARAHRDAVALLTPDGAISYGALEARSLAIAAFLRAQGVRRGDVVGLLAYRGAGAIAGMLGALRAGACFAPFDPGYPPEQLAFMAADCAPKLILADDSLLASAAASTAEAAPVARIAEAEAAPVASLGEPEPVRAEDLAYIMYTSGSTGRPKGVCVRHRGVVRLVHEQSYARFGPDETILHLAPLAFDASTFEIWGALLHGGRLAIVADAHPSLDVIAETISRHRASVAWLTAGLFHLMVDHRLDALKPLRQLLAGGDVLSPSHIEKALAALPDCQITNGYGPTENTTFTCCYPIPRSGWGGGAVPIGTPIAHTSVHLLGPDMRPVADGEAGQLCCGGDGVAAGYLKRPELTAERFVADPFSTEPGAMLYLTGDLARRRPDGLIEFLGRNDRQVKIDGKRVELDEIEAALRRDADVADAIVTLTVTPGGTKRIAAYLKPAAATPEPARSAFAARVIAGLKTRLPSHMIPSAALVIEAFPLTPSGKVDRKRLPEPGEPAGRGAAALESAASETEKTIAAIWRRALETDQVGLRDNFFDLGGTSILAQKVHAELVATLGRPIELLALFQHPTVAALAAHLAGGADKSDSLAGVADQAARRREALARARERKGKPGA